MMAPELAVLHGNCVTTWLTNTAEKKETRKFKAVWLSPCLLVSVSRPEKDSSGITCAYADIGPHASRIIPYHPYYVPSLTSLPSAARVRFA